MNRECLIFTPGKPTKLPRGQLTHVLRLTFAAHFMMSGGNILALQRILGHHDIKMTMRYAHPAPDHLDSALHYNPLATMPAPTIEAENMCLVG